MLGKGWEVGNFGGDGRQCDNFAECMQVEILEVVMIYIF